MSAFVPNTRPWRRLIDTAGVEPKLSYGRNAHQLEVAAEEAGIAVRRPEVFDRVVQALRMRDVDRDTEHTPPTK